MTQDRVILGIDPGTNIMGWGVIDASKSTPTFISMGIIDLRSEQDPYKKLSKIYSEIKNLIKAYSPTEIALESPFCGKNIQSMHKLGRAQGAAIAAALSIEATIFEYAPRKIKMAITGRGSASKEQVATIVSNILSVKTLPVKFDATDGLAVALCHYLSSSSIMGKSSPISGSNRSSKLTWSKFVESNPNRIK
jgi:crossover junction endodeoxyribonuclease RuvC